MACYALQAQGKCCNSFGETPDPHSPKLPHFLRFYRNRLAGKHEVIQEQTTETEPR